MDKLNKFIEKSKIRHNDKYCYDNVVYKSSKEKVEVICKEHGSFFVRPDAHIRKVGCPKCSGGVKYNNETFIQKCLELRGNDFVYDRVEYDRSYSKVLIGCKKHGYFSIKPSNFLWGQGCSKCSGVYRKNTSDFINESKIKHGDLYDYSKTVYKNNKNKVKIICKKHGEFLQTPKDHINGSGCSDCNISKGESKISSLLSLLGIKFERNKIFQDCNGVNGGNLPFDFYIPDKNILIEYDGRQHHEPVDKFGGVDVYKKQIINDDIRNNWCNENGIDLLRISYKDDSEKLINYLSDKYNYSFNNYLMVYNEIFEYLKSVSSEVEVNYKLNDFVCDFFLKEKNIAINIIGFWKNCDKNQSKNYNIKSKEKFAENGINLINIFEDYWSNKKEIIKSRIEHITYNSKTIGARNCSIKILENGVVREFLTKNHIQGFIGSKVKIGLFHGDVLVSVMTFGSLRRNMGNHSKDDSWELLRYCNKIGWTVVGSASKLFSFFVKNFNPTQVISYADISWTSLSGSVYEKIGLKKEHISKPSYYYVQNGVKKNRFLYRKDVLVSNGHDINMTEFQICDSLGYLRVYDTGTIKYRWIKD